MIPKQPAHISPHCDRCRTQLQLVDLIYSDEGTIYYPRLDEWACPKCLDGLIYYDFAKESDK